MSIGAKNLLPVAPTTLQPQTRQIAKPPTQAITPAISLASGAFAGAIEATITYPFEFAKTRAQLAQRFTHHGVGLSKNPFAVISQTVRQDGFRAVYTGCSTLILGTACKAGVRFLSFDAIKNKLASPDGRLSPAGGISAGMIAGAVESITVVTPTERLKTALIDDARSSQRRFNGGAQALRSILADHGVREVYRGLVSTTLKQSATSAVRMGSYNILKETAYSLGGPNYASGSAVIFGIGAAAGVITVYATQPFDTIKTRSQGAKGASTLEAFRDVLKDGGVRAFWRGSSMRLGRLVLSGGIVFTAYEKVSSFLISLNR